MYRNKESFNKQNGISKPAVREIIKSLEDWGHWLVIDTQDKEEFWDKDVDIIVDDQKYIEVKFDTHLCDTGNLFVENISCVETGSLGWLQKSKCDELNYVEYRGNDEYSICHCFRMSELRDYIKNYSPKYIKSWDRQDKKTKGAYLVPVDEVKKFESYDSFLLSVAI